MKGIKAVSNEVRDFVQTYFFGCNGSLKLTAIKCFTMYLASKNIEAALQQAPVTQAGFIAVALEQYSQNELELIAASVKTV